MCEQTSVFPFFTQLVPRLLFDMTRLIPIRRIETVKQVKKTRRKHEGEKRMVKAGEMEALNRTRTEIKRKKDEKGGHTASL